MSEEYYLQPPSSQLFYRVMANMMSFIGAGDRETWGFRTNAKTQTFNRMLVFNFAPFVASSQIVYLYVNYSDLTFDILGIMFSIIPVTILGMVNIYSSKLKSYKSISKNFMHKIHLYNVYKETKNEYVKKTLIYLERITRWTVYYLIFFFILCWIGWMSITAVNNYRNKELVLNHTMRLQTCMYFWMPFDYSYNYRNWFIVHFLNVYAVLMGISAMMIFQSLNYIYIYNIIGHIYVLKNYLRSDFTESLTDEEVRINLKKIIEYNTFILGIFKDVQDAFGLNVSANYLQNLLGNSVVLYQLMYGGKESMVIYVAMIMTYTGAAILMSFVLEEIRRQTLDLPDVVYNTPWEKMSVSNQKTVMLILQRSQIFMDFKAFGGMKAGVAPMMSILKTTFSYYVMLKSSIEN
ncbi:unnamed protein product [Euphydryas editha]|uniref:Odorant receptor n=1 Tax=Euphydryas editha TaxID=104508 RepID=A0AAU9VB95_EUPED|nr:unnamed protein product [Euphydryas editha]